MDIASADQLPPPVKLIWADGTEAIVESEDALREALLALSSFASGDTISLSRSQKHYIRAKRWNELWSVSARRGNFWTLGSFTAALSSDWSERQIRSSRQVGSLLKRIIKSPLPERALSTKQVETLFVEFFDERKFTLPMTGA